MQKRPWNEPTGSQRRSVFARVKRAVVGLVELPPDYDVLAQAEDYSLALERTEIIGSAVIIDRSGIAATAGHVVRDWYARPKRETSTGSAPYALHYLIGVPEDPVSKGRVLIAVGGVEHPPFYHSVLDIALLKLRPTAGFAFEPLKLAAGSCEEGDEVGVCGWPLGLDLHRQEHGGVITTSSFSQGIVSAVLPYSGAPQNLRHKFQIDAATSEASSGGPVFSPSTGEVLGIVLGRTEIPYRVGSTEPEVMGDRQVLKHRAIDIPVPEQFALALVAHWIRQGLTELHARLAQGRQWSAEW